MPYRFVGHTADLRMIVSGKNIKELFSSALHGMMAILNPSLLPKPQIIRHSIKIKSLDKTTLLVDFLNEVLSLSQINKAAFDKVIFKKITEKEIEAEILANKVESFQKDIKAVTYHEADIKRNKKGEWQTTLIFDI